MGSRGFVGAAVLFGALTWASSAEAQIAGGGGFGGYLYGGGGPPYNFYLQDQYLPYYSLFPPVYYSQPVARTYGWSPFAYPPNVLTPNIAVEPQEIQNPHLPQKTRLRKTDDQTAALTIINPFVVQKASATAKISRQAK